MDRGPERPGELAQLVSSPPRTEDEAQDIERRIASHDRGYTLEELTEAAASIDRACYPIRAAELDRLIAERHATGAPVPAERRWAPPQLSPRVRWLLYGVGVALSSALLVWLVAAPIGSAAWLLGLALLFGVIVFLVGAPVWGDYARSSAVDRIRLITALTLFVLITAVFTIAVLGQVLSAP